MRILKYIIPMPDEKGLSRIWMPANSEPVSVGIQNDKMVLWAAVFPCEVDKLWTFCVGNTGQEIDYVGKFIGTVTSSTGVVWHVMLVKNS